MLIEACVESVTDAVAAERLGVGRIELCANLNVGGTTPSVELLRAVVAQVQVPVVVMIRPRGGDFVYSYSELDEMLHDIEAVLATGASGIVTGVLDAQRNVDVRQLTRLQKAAGSFPVTFHRAFDQTRNLEDALEVCLEAGCARILTSGGAVRAVEGIDTLRRLNLIAGERLTLIAGGGIRADHVMEVTKGTGLSEIHLGPRRTSRCTGNDVQTNDELDLDALKLVIAQVRRHYGQ